MVTRSGKYALLPAVFALVSFLSHGAKADDHEDLPPYKMLRSLQFVQDQVVAGDQSAADIQRFMLGNIDARLRSADPSVFENEANVDAALVYAMSGGNPATLDYLVARDVNGNFDNRVTDILRKYFSGKGLLVVRSLSDTATEYQNKTIGPYLSLVAGNVLIAKDSVEALKRFDQARLAAPGTIIEEAALRRSLAVAVDKGMVDRGMGFAEKYTRRFLHSPYASQFADLFVKLVVDHNKDVQQQAIVDILSFMDEPRRREIYLRIARAAAIAGKSDLALMAAERARQLSGSDSDPFGALAEFYGGMAALPTDRVSDAARGIDATAGSSLSKRDQALRLAAQSVAEQIMAPPDPASLKQVSSPNSISADVHAAAPAGDNPTPQPVSATASRPAATTTKNELQDVDPATQSLLSTGRSKLDEIDGLLKKEGN
ncbi:chemotaxis protein MotC [Oryzifoliimicrobium ureilyticus]|uniref:chemotaxis protein MotC n=1 Tax=Oryzifoliimicrobium ureilyticus TaxID=3113724 RepID=UPI00307664BE